MILFCAAGCGLLAMTLCVGLWLPPVFAGIPEPQYNIYGKVLDESGELVTEGVLTWVFTPTVSGAPIFVSTNLNAIDGGNGEAFSYDIDIPAQNSLGITPLSPNTLLLDPEPIGYIRQVQLDGVPVDIPVGLAGIQLSLADRGEGARVDLDLGFVDRQIVGDFDGDGCTDLNDFLILLDNWRTELAAGLLGLGDFLNLLDNWQTGPNCPTPVLLARGPGDLDKSMGQIQHFSLDPPRATLSVGEPIIVRLSIDSGIGWIRGGAVALHFDPDVFEPVGEGATLTADPNSPFDLLPPIVGSGQIQIAFLSPNMEPLPYSGTLVTVSLRAIAPSESATLDFDAAVTRLSPAGTETSRIGATYKVKDEPWRGVEDSSVRAWNIYE